MEIIINYWAVLAAAITNMAIGTLWYGPLFGARWMAYMGFTKDSIHTMPLKPWQAMVGGLVTALITAFVLAHIVVMSKVVFGDMGYVTGLMTALWVWLGFAMTTQASSFLWEGKPLGLFVLNASNSFVTLMVMALILVLWT